MPILLSPSFIVFILANVLNFVLIFSGKTELHLVAGLFTISLLLAALAMLLRSAQGRAIGLIVTILALVMATLLAQQSGYA